MKTKRMLQAVLAAAIFATSAAWADVPAGDYSRLSSQYAGWAGSKANADAIVAGLRSGTPVTLVTSGERGSVSLAGFTPAGPMSYAEVRAALSNARHSLARLGIANPTAEEIQAALIGGDIPLRGGGSRSLAGVVSPKGTGPVALR